MTQDIKSLIPSNDTRRAHELTVAAGLARGLLRFAVGKGADEEALLARAGIDAADLQDQDNRIPLDKYVTLMRAAKDLARDPALALHYGEVDDLAEISVVGLIGQAAETFMEALVQLNRYNGLVVETGSVDRFQIVREGGELLLRDNRPNPNDFPELTESTFARMTCGGRRFTKMDIVNKFYVTPEAPAHRNDYERVLQVPVVFASGKNALVLDEAWLTHKPAIQPRYVFGILSEHAERLLKNLQGSKTTRGRVENLLMPLLHTGDVSMDAIASKLALSRQTLFRKLKAEGTTYDKILDELRHNMALHYLSGKKVSINETAYLVGFSEAAAFSRAFKRWTGKSPSEIRKATL